MKTILLLGFLGLLISTFGQETNRNVQLTGQIEDMGNSKLYIGKIGNYFMNSTIIDSFECINDTFSYETNFQKSNDLFCIQDINGQLRYFLPDNDKIIFNGKSDKLFNTYISGSESNILLSDYWESLFTYSKQFNPLYSSFGKAKEEHDSIKMQTIELKIDSLGEVIMWTLPEDFVRNNYNNTASAAILYLNLSIFRRDIAKLNSLYSNLDNDIQDCPLGIKVKEFITSLETCGVGKPFIDSELVTNENENISISSLKGKYFLIEFWTTWCGPCRGELPFLSKAYEKYNTKGFEIISISLDNSKERWMGVLEKQNTPWIQTINKDCDSYDYYAPFESDVAKAYSVLNVPSNYLINSDGVIIATDLRGNALLDKLLEIYKE